MGLKDDIKQRLFQCYLEHGSYQHVVRHMPQLFFFLFPNGAHASIVVACQARGRLLQVKKKKLELTLPSNEHLVNKVLPPSQISCQLSLFRTSQKIVYIFKHINIFYMQYGSQMIDLNNFYLKRFSKSSTAFQNENFKLFKNDTHAEKWTRNLGQRAGI